MKNCLHHVLLLSIFLGSCLLGACGKTGPLYLPDSNTHPDSPVPAQQDK